MDGLAEILSSSTVIIAGLILIVLGYAGSVLPALPGAPLALISVWMVHLSGMHHYAWYVLAAVTIMALGISLVDYVLPVWGTRRYGGSPAGVKGSAIGLVIGVLMSFIIPAVGMLGILAGPFLGAYIGEKMAGHNHQIAFKSAVGSFLGFIAGTLGKLFATTIISFVFLYGVISYFF
jgi:uncharacterized protein